MPTTAAIEVAGLQRRFAGVVALQGIDARMGHGRVTGLVGPDGAGKTTLLRLLAGLLAPGAGTVRVLGLDPVADAGLLRPRVAYMPQKFGLYEDLTVGENLALHAELRGVRGAARTLRLDRLLAFTDLGRFIGRPAGKLSGGMKQKLGLACALVGEPEVLLLDEPSVGVDPISRRELWRMVHELAGTGIAVLWSTSYLDEAERCDEVLVLHEGRCRYAGAPAALTAGMAGRVLQLRGIAGSRRQVLQRLVLLPEVLDATVQGQALRLVLRTGRAAPSPTALGAGAGARCVPVPPRFEDAFMDLLGGAPAAESPLARLVAPVPAGVHDQAVIEAQGLTRRFGDFVATDRVSFAVRRGEIFGLLGPNGAGKSTTFRMLCGLLAPSAGSARVMGMELATAAGLARQQLGYMAQKFSLYGNLSVAQNLEFFAGVYGLARAQRRERIGSMVAAFGLTPYVASAAEELALGFKQRLALACALLHQPPVLFLDEPTSGVDPITRREFWSHINGLVERGVTVMVTTHFMDEAEYCDRIGLVYRGELIATGTPDELKGLVAGGELADPTMEDAFVGLVQRHDLQHDDREAAHA